MLLHNVLRGLGLFVAGITLSQSTITAQHITQKWTRTYGGVLPEQVHAIIPTSDGGFALTGITESFSKGKSDIFFLKTDKTGNSQSWFTFGGTDEDVGYGIMQTGNNEFVLAGYTRSFGSGGEDACLFKVGTSGTQQWSRNFGGTEDDRALSCIQTPDRGFVLVGWTKSFGTGGDGFIIKTDSLGRTLWTRIYGTSRWDAFHHIAPTNDGGFIIAGESQTADSGLAAWIVKVDMQGLRQWEKGHGGEFDESAYSVAQCADGGYVVAGSTNSFGAGDDDGFVLRLNGAGDQLWSQTKGGKCSDKLYSVTIAGDGDFLLVGNSASSGPSKINGYLVNMDANGQTRWESAFPGIFNMGSALRELSNGDLALAVTSPAQGNTNVLCGVISYTDESGNDSIRTVYTQSFTCIDSLQEIGWGGFKKPYWILNKEEGFLQSKAPGNNGGVSRIFSPDFSGTRDSGSLRVDLNVGFPTPRGFNWHHNNAFSFALCANDGTERYTVKFKPNRSIDTSASQNIELYRGNTLLAKAKTGRTAPNGSGAAMSQLSLTLKKDNTITVRYDAQDGLGLLTYISYPDGTYRDFSRLFLNYKTGSSGDGQYFMVVDAVAVIEYKE